MRLIEILIKSIIPLVFIFGVFPKVMTIFKEVFEIDEKPKKKKPKPDLRSMRQVGLPGHSLSNLIIGENPPPPPPRNELLSRRERMAKELDQYEVRDGRIVKKKQSVYDDEMWDDELTTLTQVTKSTPHQPKKKHFNKGVDPDFL